MVERYEWSGSMLMLAAPVAALLVERTAAGSPASALPQIAVLLGLIASFLRDGVVRVRIDARTIQLWRPLGARRSLPLAEITLARIRRWTEGADRGPWAVRSSGDLIALTLASGEVVPVATNAPEVLLAALEAGGVPLAPEDRLPRAPPRPATEAEIRRGTLLVIGVAVLALVGFANAIYSLSTRE